MAEYLNIDLIPATPNVTTKYSISVNINPAAIPATLPLKNNEANYRLVVSGQTSPSITISGQGRPGVFYGIQTLLSLSDSGEGKIPTGSVDDGPRFDYRGMHIDVCRNFHTTDDLMRLLDAMATYKLNNLHLHLGDDEGWRLEIPEIPELIEVRFLIMCRFPVRSNRLVQLLDQTLNKRFIDQTVERWFNRLNTFDVFDSLKRLDLLFEWTDI